MLELWLLLLWLLPPLPGRALLASVLLATALREEAGDGLL